MRRLTVLGVLAMALVTLGANPAPAHEGAGTLVVLSATPTDASSVRYEVSLVFTADGHPANDSTVTAVIDPAPDGFLPVTLERADADGVYAGVVTFPAPGDWVVRFTAVTPAATVETTQPIAPPVTTTTPTTPPPDPTTTATTGTSLAPPVTDTPDTGAPATDGGATEAGIATTPGTAAGDDDSSLAEIPGTENDSGDGGGTATAVVAVVAVVAVAGAAVILLRARRRAR
jgi:hypothetical protein